ncbi:MAG: hypothetical protein ACRDTA_07265 [Pseudonocardiaceae bacterium]
MSYLAMPTSGLSVAPALLVLLVGAIAGLIVGWIPHRDDLRRYLESRSLNWRQQLTERVTLAIGALHGIREHDWIMGGDTALCHHCLHVVPVVPINAEGDWRAGTVFCSETAPVQKRSRLATAVDRITAAYDEFTRAYVPRFR